MDLDPDAMAGVTSQLAGLAAGYGRDAKDLMITLKLRMPPPRHAAELAGADPSDLVDLLTRYHAAGVDLIVYDLMVLPDPLAALTWLGHHVLPALTS